MKLRNKLAALLGAGVLTIGVAGVAFAASYDWQTDGNGQGWPNQTCSTAEGSLPATMLWVWTGDSPTSLTINSEVQSGSWTQNGNGSFHFVATVDATNYPPTDASIEYTGEAGILTLSHCDGAAAPTETPAAPTETPAAPTATPDLGGGGDTLAPTQPPTDTLGSNSTGPSDGAWLLVVALGVLLASVVVLTPARAKSRR
jgi:hypothetical protein